MAPRCPVDTGFMVYNERTYPLLTRLFAHLGVPTEADRDVILGQHRRRLAGVWRRLARRRSWRSAATCCARLSCACCSTSSGSTSAGLRYLGQAADDELTLGQFLARHGFGRGLGEWYLLPMAAAIWSAPVARMLDYPARSFLSFFANHGLLSVQRPSCLAHRDRRRRQYVERHGRRVQAAHPARHPDQRHTPLALGRGGRRRPGRAQPVRPGRAGLPRRSGLGHARGRQRRASARCWALSATSRTGPSCTATPRLMPRRRAVWSSWNYLAGAVGRPGPSASR